MSSEFDNAIFSQKLTDKEFSRLADFIYSNYGIKMPPSKKIMLEGRLHKRLRATGHKAFATYVDFLFTEEGAKTEVVQMIDVVTTNKTDFFREPHHFNYLSQEVFPKFSNGNPVKIWSAGCSTGEEPYTIAICAEEFSRDKHKIDYNITASDLSTQVLAHASQGIYDIRRIEVIPLELKKRYFLKSKSKEVNNVRLVPKLRSVIDFKRINFMDNTFPLASDYDVIFCRNVIIYFDKETQQVLLSKLCNHLKKGGVLFLGHSESINELDLPLIQTQPTVYIKQ